jgi:predicted dehydrogenase
MAASIGLTAALGRIAGAEERPKKIRVGNIGTGIRGTELTRLIANYPDVEVVALCDLLKWKVDNGIDMVQGIAGNRPDGYWGDEYAYRKMLERDDIDAIMVNTPIVWHIQMSVESMRAGKDVGSEITAGHEIDGLWKLVDTKEQTGRLYMLLENYIYTPSNMTILNMVRQGLFGTAYYAEGGYLHDCRQLRFDDSGKLTWRGESVRDFYGNSYASHALGPVSKWMGINDGDRMKRLVCMMTRPRNMHAYAVEKFGENSDAAKVDFKLGEMVSTMIYTEEGRVIQVDLDVHSPRPETYYYTLQGTKGCYDNRSGVYLEGISPWDQWESIARYNEEKKHPWWQKWGDEAKSTGHWGSDYFVIHDFVRMLRTRREPWIDVYDAAAWSSIFECTHKSLDQGNAPVEMPDFTRGKWKSKDWRADNLKPVLDA